MVKTIEIKKLKYKPNSGVKDTTNSKIDLGKTIIAIRSQFDAANRMDEIEITRERCKILCKAHGLKWCMILYIGIDQLRWAIEKKDLDNFLLNR